MIELRKTAKTWLTLLGVVAVCVLLNIAGSFLVGAFGLPVFIDSVGTVLAALLGGYVPCITVGFLTNVIGGMSDPVTTYYCVINVLIAVAAAAFARRGWLTKFPKVIAPVAVFALLGGVVGGLLTWFIYGFSFGEGFAVDFAAQINHVLPVGYLPSNLIATFLIDLLDKAVVTALALLIFFLLPKRLKELLSERSWYYHEEEEVPTRRKLTLRHRLTLLVAVSTSLVAATAIGVCVVQYNTAMVDKYAETGGRAAKVIADIIDERDLDGFLQNGRKAEDYADTELLLAAVRDSSSEIQDVTVYRIGQDGAQMIFDLNADVNNTQPGAVVPYNETITKYSDRFLKGEEIPSEITNGKRGEVLSVYRPVCDNSGNLLCYVGVDMSMDALRSQEYAFLARIISLFIGFLLVIRSFAIWMAESRITRPINSIANAAEQVSCNTPQERADSMAMLESLHIDTGDEIEHLYEAYKSATADTVRFIDEVEKKSAQISRLQNGLVMVLADMVESRDQCTGDHVRKTAAYTEIILRQMQKEGIYADQLSEDYIEEVVSSAPLHDVGKIAISDAILNKPGKLTDEEFMIMKTHTIEGGEVIEKAMAMVAEESEYLTEAKNLAEGHHEKWNGKGYPKGLAGEEIPLSARVMAVADVFDALVSRRSYKEPFSVDKALDIITQDAGSHFDPNVVKAFLDAEDEVRRVAAMNMDL